MKRFIFSCSLLIAFLSSFSQDPPFLNANQSLLYMNPSFAGSNGGVRNQFSYRNQWPFADNYGYMQTYLNTLDVYLPSLKGGVAVSALHDNLMNGELKASVLSLSYAQYFSANDGNLKIIPSVQFSYGKRNLDLRHFASIEAIDPRYGGAWASRSVLPFPQKEYFDVSSGLLLNYQNKLYVGGSVFHINQPDVGLLGTVKMPRAVNLHASYNFTISKWSNVQVLYRYQNQDKLSSNQIGINVITCKHLITGIAYTIFDIPQFNLGYRNNYFTLVAGYDFTFSELAGNTDGSLEVHASFNLRNKERRRVLTNFESW